MGLKQELGSRQDKCDGSIDHIARLVKRLAQTLDHIAPLVGNAEFAAAVSKCLSCGRNRSVSPFIRSQSPPLEINGSSRRQHSSPTRSGGSEWQSVSASRSTHQ